MTAAPDVEEVPPPSGRAPHERSLHWKLLQMLARIMATLLYDLKVWGLENVPATGGVLLVANHQSYLDPVMLAVRLRRPMSYFAKSELFKNRLFGGFIRSLNAFPVNRGRSDKAAIEQTIQRLQHGELMNIFPEGTRTLTGEIQPMQRGAALIVRRAGVPIIPVVIDGSYAAWPKGSAVPHPHPVRVLYGKPLEVDGLKGDAIMELIDRTLREMFSELRRREAVLERTFFL